MSQTLDKFGTHIILALIGLMIAGGIPLSYNLYYEVNSGTDQIEDLKVNQKKMGVDLIVTNTEVEKLKVSNQAIKENIAEIKSDVKSINQKLDRLLVEVSKK